VNQWPELPVSNARCGIWRMKYYDQTIRMYTGQTRVYDLRCIHQNNNRTPVPVRMLRHQGEVVNSAAAPEAVKFFIGLG